MSASGTIACGSNEFYRESSVVSYKADENKNVEQKKAEEKLLKRGGTVREESGGDFFGCVSSS